ncbi:vacuolar ATPase assembly protein VMA22 [Dermacentor variabilis]|uniref:vacuolar ATPase assembly protein VMA22 n=1 Tax=Dermacentor variabilis TaxID=34621 RepID=UPI003F5B7F23
MAEKTLTSVAPTETAKTTVAETGKLDDSTDRERETLLENAIVSAEKILQLRESLNELIENGLLELARVRYSTGNKSVSALQLNMGEVEALRTVRSNFEDQNQPYPSFELLQPDGTGSTTKEGEVRQRRQAEDPSRGAAESPPQRPTSPTDPLRWFGVLVPQSLRRSQKCFISALEVVVDVANEQSRLAVALDTYRTSRRAATVPDVEP